MAHSLASPTQSLDQLCIDTVRALSMDAVQRANSGHPGTPMALAPLIWLLFTRHLRHNPANPAWTDRDRFVLSAGHASMLLYSALYLSGYDLSLDDIKQFRQWDSRTPGHPEYGVTPGVEVTTGPLGQGVGNAVGFAIAEAHLAALFNTGGHRPVDHHTWFIASDGDMMEGASHEAASLAGHLRLGKLIGFYDDNHITIEGDTALAFDEDVGARYRAYGWQVQHVADGNDLDALDAAIRAAQAETGRPSLIVVRTHIAYGSPNKVDTAEAHGSPLGEEEVRLTKQALGWPSLEPFFVPEDALAEWRKCRERGAALESEWRRRHEAFATARPNEAKELERRLRGDLPAGWDADIPTFPPDKPIATRNASEKVINAIAPRLPELMGGAADLAPSTKTLMKQGGDFEAGNYAARNMHFGVREHGMGSVLNGMALHGGILPYGASFLIFSDYMRPPIRLAALMERQVIYVYTHDSIGLGEDGPDPSADRDAGDAARHPASHAAPSGRRERDRGGLARGDRPPGGSGGDRAEPAEPRRGGPLEIRRRVGRRPRGVRPVGGGGRTARGHPARQRLGGRDRARGAGEARRAAGVRAGGERAEPRALRPAAGVVPRRGAATRHPPATRRRGGASDAVVSLGRRPGRGHRPHPLRRLRAL